jgi:predicted transposase YbfD/YdcC
MIESATVKRTSCYDYFKSEEINRGRLETRIIHVFGATEEIKEYLPHIKAVVRVKRIRQNKKNTSEEIIYYVSDVEYTAKRFYKGIREHWSIENKLHWVKDVVMLEDKSAITNIQLAPILSLLKSHVIELAYLNYSGVTNFLRTIAHNIEQMCLLLE